MENSFQEPYRDSPPRSRTASPAPRTRMSSAKPPPSTPTDSPLPSGAPYCDAPSSPAEMPIVTPPQPQHNRAASNAVNHEAYRFPPYTDASPDHDDDVPLAYLYPYPTEAPPAYNIAVRQSYRDTLISHIPSGSNVTSTTVEEAGIAREHADDVQFVLERLVAKIIVLVVLLIILVVIVWQVLRFKKLI